MHATLIVVMALSLGGCAGYQAYHAGQSDIAAGRLESGLTKLKRAVDEDPRNVEYRTSYFTQRDAAVSDLLRRADLATDAGDFGAARIAYEQILRLDPANARATSATSRVDAAERHWKMLEAAMTQVRAGDVEGAIGKAQHVLSENANHARASLVLKQLMRQQADKTGRELGIHPKLKQAYRKSVTLSFAGGATLGQVFEALKQASGLNYMLDKDVRTDQRVTLSVTAKPVEDVLRLLLATHQLERRVLDEDTLLIYPNTPAKAAEYREMVVRAFYLSNADASEMAASVRTIAKARDVVVDKKLNLLMVRDSAEIVRLAEKVIAAQDVPEPEVMLELEVLEISVNRLLEMGISWPSSASVSVFGTRGAGQITLDDWRHRNDSMVQLNVPNPAISAQLRSQKGDANLLANPRVRVRNRQSAKILIGERVPVFTTIATANVGTSESVNYLDVGLKLDIEPTVSLDNEVSMKLALEVSNILETITRVSGTQAYRLGTRNTSTTLRVRDGETNILAGLIQRDERRSNTGVPGLNEVPLVSKLFGAAQDSDTRTEIVLLVTPRIVRNIELPGVGLQEFLAGTESAVGATPIQLGAPVPAVPGVRSPAQQPAAAPPVQPAPGAQPAPGNQMPPAFTPPPIVPLSPAAPTQQPRNDG
jgi:general secretion pathway protein D